MLKLGILVLALHPANIGRVETTATLIQQTIQSGRAETIAESASERVQDKRQIAPGPPPTLSFRLYEGRTHHRYEDSGLMLDDAGH